MKRIGLLGGTFDPVHIGHLIIAEVVREEYELDRILFIPNLRHAFKDNHQILSVEHRLAMLRLALAGNPCFAICELEIARDGTSYSIDTVRQLYKTYARSQHQLYFIIGSDNLPQLHRWKEIEELTALCRFIVFKRSGFDVEQHYFPPNSNFSFTDTPLNIDISSSTIRQRTVAGESIRYLVPPEVERYILDKRLYA